jgi:hypothetical protein
VEVGKLYFVKDEFYEKFKGCGLLENKEMVNGKQHGRPCCYLFKFNNSDEEIYWMIPISSKISTYKAEYDKSIKKYSICDNISFGYVLGEQRAFLPQNLFPVTRNYIIGTYKDINTGLDIVIPKDLVADLNKKARKKIRYNQQGKKFGMTDIMRIYNELIKEVAIK